MAGIFQGALETDFPAAVNWWVVNLPAQAVPGSYVVVMMASPAAGILWTPAAGWEPIDGFATVQFSLAGSSRSPQAIPISFAVFAKFLTPRDGAAVSFPIIGTPTAVVGANPGAAIGVAVALAYGKISAAQPLRELPWTNLTPRLQLSYGSGGGSTINEVVPPYNPVTSAAVPAIFAEAADILLTALVELGSPAGVTPPAGTAQRLATTGGPGVGIVAADITPALSGFQSGLAWTAGSIPTPCLTEALALWPDAGNLAEEIVLFASLDRSPVHFGYRFSQEPTVIQNAVGYVFKVYAGTSGAPQALFNPRQIVTASLLFTRSDGSTFAQSLQTSPDNLYGYCVSQAGWFPYEGDYQIQLQIQYTNGSLALSSQMYLAVQGSAQNSAGGNMSTFTQVNVNALPYSMGPDGFFFIVSQPGNFYLPVALGSGRKFVIKNISNGTITVLPALNSPGDTIDNGPSFPLIALGSSTAGQNSISLEDGAIGSFWVW